MMISKKKNGLKSSNASSIEGKNIEGRTIISSKWIIDYLLKLIDNNLNCELYTFIEFFPIYKAKIKSLIKYKVSEIPEKFLTKPDINVIIAFIEYLKSDIDKEYKMDIYVNLIMKNIDVRNKKIIHNSFLSIIKDLNYNDILLLDNLRKIKKEDIISLNVIDNNSNIIDIFNCEKYFTFIKHNINLDELTISINNLIRLNLISLFMSSQKKENILENWINILHSETIKNISKEQKCDLQFQAKQSGYISLTNLGEIIANLCIIENYI